MEKNDRPVALVTGGATGVGRACVLQFAKRGWDVIINFSRSAREAEETAAAARELDSRALVFKADVADDAQVGQMFEAIAGEFGRLDALVNNAAMTYFIPSDDLEQMTSEKWDRILDVNLKGAFFCSRAATPLLRQASSGGSIVNVTSTAGKDGVGSCVAYAASKGALNTMTKTLARALSPDIRVNAVLPGPIDSRWILEGDNDWDLAKMTARDPIPRASQPEDIADAILFLSIDASMVTGHLMAVDGGRTM